MLEVNGIEMKGRNVNQVCDILSEMTGKCVTQNFSISYTCTQCRLLLLLYDLVCARKGCR